MIINEASKREESSPYNPILIEISNIRENPYQTRILYDEVRIRSLAESIRNHGLLSPIMIRPHPNISEEYECCSGHLRIRASKLAGLDRIPAFIQELSDKEMAELCLVENQQRNDLNPLEEARGYKNLIENFSYNQQRISYITGRSRSAIANSLRLLNMNQFLQECVLCGTLEPSKALLISTLPPEFEQYHLADVAMDWSLTKKELAKAVDDIKRKERFISWIREVPVSRLRKHPGLTYQKVTEQELQESPLLLDTSGLVIDFRDILAELVRLDATKVRGEILYSIDYLRKRESSTKYSGGFSIERGIAQEMNDEQREKMRCLTERLQTHDRHYPVNVIISY
jgi:ParB family chromosome partitioning protein